MWLEIWNKILTLEILQIIEVQVLWDPCKSCIQNFVLMSCPTNGGDFKIVLHKAQCLWVCDKPSKLKTEKQPLYEKNVLYWTESQDRQCSSFVKCESPQEEEELYIDMLLSAKQSSLNEYGTSNVC